MHSCNSRLTFAVSNSVDELFNLFNLNNASSISSSDEEFTPPPDLSSDWICIPAALPKTTKSNNEFPPSLFAPCTETHAASPTENNPSIT